MSTTLAQPLDLTQEQLDRLARLHKFAALLDTSFTVPGTQIRFGVDALVGLIPGFGDLVMVFASAYIIVEAARFGAPKAVLYRMITNVGIEAIVGIIPIFGDIFDIVFKANMRNLKLLDRYIESPQRTQRLSQAFVALSASGVIFALVGLICLVFLLVALLVFLIYKLIQ